MWRPLHKFNFCRLFGFEPHRLCHDFFCYRMLMLALFLWQVYKGDAFGFQVLHGSEYFHAVELIETRNQAFDVIQLSVTAVFANEQFANPVITGKITAYEEFVLLIESLFQPQIRFIPWVIVTSQSLCHKPFNFRLSDYAGRGRQVHVWAELKDRLHG